MTWQAEVDELNRRKELALAMGGPEGIARQHAGGKLTVRERIDRLADPGSWREFRSLGGQGTYDGAGELVAFTSKGAVEGTCTLDGRDRKSVV